MQLKNHENPRSQGRNSKGRGGAARARQVKKAQRRMARRLKQGAA